MRKINVIGYSGSGKTYLIKKGIKKLKDKFDMDSAVIKNIHEHQIDKQGKDSYLYTKVGANYAITKNIYDETTIFIKKSLKINDLIDWLARGPFKIDIIFTEGFRDLKIPTILCLKDWEKLEEQYNEYVKMISGIICVDSEKSKINDVPVIDIEKNFKKFLEIFEFS